MDILEFSKQKRRMCGSFSTCEECELFEGVCSVGYVNNSIEDDKKIIETVEKWAAEHPLRTRQNEFLKMFPNAKTDERGVLAVPPCVVDSSCGVEKTKANCCIGKTCAVCRRDFWFTPLEELR